MTPVSLRPLIIVGNLGAWSYLETMLLSLSYYMFACRYFSTLAEYFMYSHLSYFLYITSMLCCSEDEEFFDEVFF
jgi:hypothetical protein